MVRFLSPDWLDALDRAVVGDEALAAATAGLSLTVEQRITPSPGPVGVEAEIVPDVDDFVFHVAFDHGTVRVRPGPVPGEPTVTFSQDEATARGIAAGTASAQRSFMTGHLRVGGDLRVLLDHQAVLAGLHDVFASVTLDDGTATTPTDEADGAGDGAGAAS